ncbi:hypothetical protein UWK_02528 [Desulfocapsa sulfexigens DSM 10523]|uniref:Uncharacterized protein n=1 Tax=Desulfocapsa sulfexigens (strain DSM 10523 / SB164P1) TaxID=1167006 RepID=M1NHI2_DESSD|nr:hypothetical protein [Desulfocapsa sulfexigens]AGF79064.1 hypothetical protein UWK_02528 [Desulfocapsa sulfexigens DSM 10523]
MKIMICFLVVLFLAAPIFAMDTPQQTRSCHCFQDRVFDPDRKFAADKYLLTTSFNSFISANFHISKSQIVMMKMKGGVDPDDLLIGLFVARICDVEVNSLLAILDSGGTWKQILTSRSLKKNEKNKNLLNTLLAAIDTEEAAVEVVTDQLVKEFFRVSDLEIASLREEGATGREIVLIYLMERYGKTDATAADILSMYTKKKMSWGEIASYFGLTPKETGKLLQNQG